MAVGSPQPYTLTAPGRVAEVQVALSNTPRLVEPPSPMAASGSRPFAAPQPTPPGGGVGRATLCPSTDGADAAEDARGVGLRAGRRGLVRYWAGNVGTGTGPCGLSQYPTNNSSKVEVSISGDCYRGDRSVPEQLDGLASLVRHEVGHSLGFSHTDGGGQFGALGGAGCWTGTVPLPPLQACPPDHGQVSAIERYHAALAYARPPGNLDVDVDPVSPITFSTEVGLTVHLGAGMRGHPR